MANPKPQLGLVMERYGFNDQCQSSMAFGREAGVTEQWNNIQANNFIAINAENNSTIIINA
tara:strand:+ start:2545 stop:2727 length:183 start_codon:yes stop_codon:yes gene_type:complete